MVRNNPPVVQQNKDLTCLNNYKFLSQLTINSTNQQCNLKSAATKKRRLVKHYQNGETIGDKLSTQRRMSTKSRSSVPRMTPTELAYSNSPVFVSRVVMHPRPEVFKSNNTSVFEANSKGSTLLQLHSKANIKQPEKQKPRHDVNSWKDSLVSTAKKP